MKNNDKTKGRCAKRTHLERVLIAVSLLLLCFVLALFIIMIMQYGQLFTFETKICTKPGCIKAASQILDTVNTTKDPCDDFYGFVCGYFLKESLKYNEISPLARIQEMKDKEIDSLITMRSTKPMSKGLELQKQFYRTCLNTEAIETDDSDAFYILMEKLGGWPVLKGRFWYEPKFNWISFMVQARKLGVHFEYFLEFDIVPESDNSEILRLSVRAPTKYVNVQKLWESYTQLMTDIAVIFDAPEDQARSEFDKVLQFHEQLISIATVSKESDNTTLLQIGEIQEKFAQIPWISLLNNITGTLEPLNNSSLVLFKAESYLINLLELLRNFPKRTQANYLIWRVVEDYGDYLKINVRERLREFYKIISPPRFQESRKSKCLHEAKFYFPAVAEIAYVREHIGKREWTDIHEIVFRIKDEVLEQVKSISCFDNETKSHAENLINGLKLINMTSDEDFNELLNIKGLDFQSENIIDMLTQLKLRLEGIKYKNLNKKVSEIKEVDRIFLKINSASLVPSINKLILTTPILQDLVYNYERPKSLNFGALGSIFGHEISQALTPQENYNSKCLIDFYHVNESYFETNGSLELNRNIVNFNAPNVAYKAYRKWLKGHGGESRLPGLDYSENQLFWMMVGAIKCYQPLLKSDGGEELSALIGSLQNSPYFAKDFNCHAGSKMNPKDKCLVIPV